MAFGDHQESLAKAVAQSNHHPCDSRKGRSCQMERKGLFFCVSTPLPLSFYLCFSLGPLLPSLCFCIFHIHILSILSLSSHPNCPPLPSRPPPLVSPSPPLPPRIRIVHLVLSFFCFLSLSSPPPLAGALTQESLHFHANDILGI